MVKLNRHIIVLAVVAGTTLVVLIAVFFLLIVNRPLSQNTAAVQKAYGLILVLPARLPRDSSIIEHPVFDSKHGFTAL